MEIELKRFYRFLAPRPTVIVTTIDREKRISAAAVSFVMPVSMDPPLLAISLSRKVDMENINRTREFVINIPTRELLAKVWACSRTHPGEADEIKSAGFTEMPSAKVLAPSIGDCIGWFECLCEFSKEFGDHVLMVGSVAHATVKDDVLGKDGDIDLEKVRLLMHIAGPKFAASDGELRVQENEEAPAAEKGTAVAGK